MSIAACAPPRPDYPVIGAKNFTEQVVLGELLAQHIEARTGMKVERRFYLAGSYICNQALIAGRHVLNARAWLDGAILRYVAHPKDNLGGAQPPADDRA